MNTHLELEYKVMLTEHQYERLCQRFDSTAGFSQINTYYRYSESEKQISVRIRTVDNSRTLTFKLAEGDARREINFMLDEDETEVFNREDVREFLIRNDMKGTFTLIGNLVTDRILIKEPHGELCLDKNMYLGIQDYELEYEVTGDPKLAYARFLEILELEHIDYLPAMAKYSRFLIKQRL